MESALSILTKVVGQVGVEFERNETRLLRCVGRWTMADPFRVDPERLAQAVHQMVIFGGGR